MSLNPRTFLPSLKKLFFAFGGIKCASSKKAFFTNEAWHEAQLILREVRPGYYSDPKDFPLYFEKVQDSNGLLLYRCIRGTNSLEGGVHQNLIAKFSHFNLHKVLLQLAA
ncbi:hypothetical protein LIPSTDRAFT_277289 [Lipomyces starkeyi NRRL Y-11557]|uniref:Uncharacterized protein n=1 Tax=Lipomyces starkeyi NRRL Y-11557 TaxID=675824 RepID=A0A1E3Q6R1_LIPST|nr:hypothetical protein LIPSTDRAFT_277289 [Lipomyces starkeyi NRRL Y-11557]